MLLKRNAFDIVAHVDVVFISQMFFKGCKNYSAYSWLPFWGCFMFWWYLMPGFAAKNNVVWSGLQCKEHISGDFGLFSFTTAFFTGWTSCSGLTKIFLEWVVEGLFRCLGEWNSPPATTCFPYLCLRHDPCKRNPLTSLGKQGSVLSLGRQQSRDPRTWTLKPGGSDLSLLLTPNSCITFGLGQVT